MVARVSEEDDSATEAAPNASPPDDEDAVMFPPAMSALERAVPSAREHDAGSAASGSAALQRMSMQDPAAEEEFVPPALVTAIRYVSDEMQEALLHSVLKMSPESASVSYIPVFTLDKDVLLSQARGGTSMTDVEIAQLLQLRPAADVSTSIATLRSRVWDLLTDPSSSTAAWLISILVMCCIIWSTCTFCIDTLPGVPGHSASMRELLSSSEVAVVTVFTAEYLLRLCTCPRLAPYLMSLLNFIDLLAILPYYLELALIDTTTGANATRILRVVRLVRVFRILKLGTRFSKLQLIRTVVQESLDVLGMLLFMLSLAVLLFSTLIYYAENMSLHEEDQYVVFKSIPHSFWWCIVTLMTVGYGDMVPTTVAGKVVAALAMIVAVVILALPISVIGTNFTSNWVKYKTDVKRAERAVKVLGGLKALLDSLDDHNKVLKDLSQAIRACESTITTCIRELTACLKEVNRLYSQGMSAGAPSAQVLKNMKFQVDRIQKLLTWVNQYNGELQTLHRVAALATEANLVASINSSATQYAGLFKWFEEGSYLLEEHHNVTTSLDAVKATVSSASILSKVSAQRAASETLNADGRSLSSFAKHRTLALLRS